IACRATVLPFRHSRKWYRCYFSVPGAVSHYFSSTPCPPGCGQRHRLFSSHRQGDLHMPGIQKAVRLRQEACLASTWTLLKTHIGMNVHSNILQNKKNVNRFATNNKEPRLLCPGSLLYQYAGRSDRISGGW